MTYISEPIKRLYEMNEIMGECAQIPEFRASNSLLQNVKIVAYEIGSRVMAAALAAFATLYSPLYIIFGIGDLALLNIRILSEREVLSPAIVNVNIAFIKALGVGYVALFSSILSPQYVHNNLNAKNILLRHLAEALVEIPADLNALAHKMNVDLSRLPNAHTRLENWRSDLVNHLARSMLNQSSYERENFDEPSFLNFNFTIYKAGFRALLLQRGYSALQVDEVLPPERLGMRDSQSIARRVFGLMPGVDLRHENHVECLGQFRQILYQALLSVREELLDGSEFDRLKEQVGKLKAAGNSTDAIFKYLKEKSIIPRAAETPEQAINRQIEKVQEVLGEIAVMKIEGKSSSKILEYLKANSIRPSLEMPDQVINRKLEEVTALRFAIAQMRAAGKTASQITEFLKTKSIIVLPSDELPVDALIRKTKEYEEIKITIAQMKANSKPQSLLIGHLRSKGIELAQETPQQATLRQIEQYKALKERVSELRRTGAKSEAVAVLLRVNSIAMQSLETLEELIERTKKERTYSRDEISSMKDGAYAAMLDRALLKIVEMATLDVSASGVETLVLMREPQDLKLSLQKNIYGIFQDLLAIHDRTTQFSQNQWTILRRLLNHKDLDPDQLIDSSVTLSAAPRVSQVPVKSAGLVKDAYRKIVALRQATIDRRIIHSNNSEIVDTLNFSTAFQC